MSLPFREVNERLTGEQVAREVGLKPARELRKVACPQCDSTDGCHAYPKPGAGAFCFSCGTAFSAIDLAVVAWGLTPADACRRLADRFGIPYDDTPGHVPARPSSTPRAEGPVEPGLEPVADSRRAEAQGAVVSLSTLGPLGRDYLNGRGLDPDHAAVLGFGAWESEKEARAIVAQVGEVLGPDAIEAAGFGSSSRVWLPWAGKFPALIIPTFSREGTAVHSLRFRRMAGQGKRYLAPIGRGARLPWRAEAFDAPDPLELVIAEGELDALALVQAGYEAMALGGATPSGALLRWIVDASERVAKLALWTDDDCAGNGAVDRLVTALVNQYGAPWTRAHVLRWRSQFDACELARQGGLQ